MSSLRGRLLAAFAYVVALVLVALAIPFAFSVSARVESEVRGQAESQAHLIAASAAGRLDRPRALRQLVAGAARDTQGRVVVVDSRGRVVADSAGARFVGRGYGDRPEIAAVLRTGRVQQGTRRSDTLDDELLYTAVPVVENGRRTGAVRVTRSTAPVDARVRRDLLALAAIGAGALLLGLVLAWLLARSLARPLASLAGTARRFGRGELDARAAVAGSSEQRELAASFNEMAARLDRVLQAQREFVANASHQLRTPLTGLRLRLEAAALKADDPDLERDLAAAERETERLARVLAALLALARDGAAPGPARPVELGAAAERACERWQVEADAAGHRLECAGDGEAWAIASDEDVAIALDNLVENALRYSPPGGEVILERGVRDGTAWIAVLDRGPGLGDDDPEELFERFARGSAGRGASGTGLGLAIVRTLARRWGGDARIENRPGGGARAEVELPLAVAAPARTEVAV
jgi:signal transduction histidine kinase